MGRKYGYCRISTGRQNIERQERNIKASFPEAVVVKEVYTGTKFQGRKELEKLLDKVQPGDAIIFDSVSRMSRDSEEGFRLYESLFRRDISLVFLKEPHINTETYKRAMTNQVALTGDKVDLILDGVNNYLMELAREQIRIAFEQAEKEVSDLRQRTIEGIETARLNGKQIGQPRGATYETRKGKAAKEIIRKHNRSFGGSLTDAETMKQAGISRKSFYKYKREIREYGARRIDL
jgi:DNA invertase Pin-like site-specific DNA recombinase